MLKYLLFASVASSRRRKILPPRLAIALVGSMMLLPSLAGASTLPGSSPGGVRLTATSQQGTVAITRKSADRYAWSDQRFYLTADFWGVPPARPAQVRVTESWLCGFKGNGSRGSVTNTVSGTYTVAEPELRCPGEGLHLASLTAVALDPLGEWRPTAELTIWVYGYQCPDDWIPVQANLPW